MKHLRTYHLAVQFFHLCKVITLKGELKDQLFRAASSIVLNLAEGSGKRTIPDQKRFYRIAMGSLRESQAILDLLGTEKVDVIAIADKLGAHLYKLTI